MQMSFTMNVNKNELNAMKNTQVKLGEHFGKSVNKNALDEKVHQKLKLKMTGGNILAFLRLKDTYDISIDIDMDESYMVEYFALFNRALPLIGGLINVFTEINKMSDSKFEVVERELIDLDAD